jgi:hypothetical protein
MADIIDLDSRRPRTALIKAAEMLAEKYERGELTECDIAALEWAGLVVKLGVEKDRPEAESLLLAIARQYG